jgi:UDP-glucose 4-epimerase
MKQPTAGEKPLCIVTGAAGFIGSHVVDRLLGQGHAVIGIDNFVRGRRQHLAPALANPDFMLFDIDCTDARLMIDEIGFHLKGKPFDTFWHLAANSDVAAGASDPGIDLHATFMTTFAALEVMKKLGLSRIAFASSSAIYGAHDGSVGEDHGPLMPASNYGAMKLASEAIISAATETFLERAWLFRFPNVVGRRGTHGVIFDLLRKLQKGPPALEVLGDGNQCKPYLHVDDIVDAMWFIWTHANDRLNFHNIGPDDEGASVRFIAEEVVRVAGSQIPLKFTGGDRGWVGDIPRFSYDTQKLRTLGWSATRNSQDAIRIAARELFEELKRP